MKLLFKRMGIALVLVALAGCKVAVLMVEGGEVQSTASGTCLAGQVCIIDVTDTSFSEAFTAVPQAGWMFDRWNSGSDFFCEGSTNVICSLSLVPVSGNAIVESVVASNRTFYIMPVFKQGQAIDDTITIAGVEWAQPDLFPQMTWEEVNAVCSGGPCTGGGTLNGLDMVGWTWASAAEVGNMLSVITPHPGGVDSYQTFFASNQWAKDVFDVYGFRPTAVLAPPFSLREVVGFVSESNHYGLVLESNVPGEPVGYAYTGEVLPFLSIIGTGIWFYRPAPPI